MRLSVLLAPALALALCTVCCSREPTPPATTPQSAPPSAAPEAPVPPPAAPAVPAAGARVVVPHDDFDFGSMTEGERRTHVYELRNEGDAPLELGEVHTSCGCTAALLSRSRVEPGGAAQVNVTFDSTGRSGVVHKKIHVETNDPATPRVVLNVRAEVIRVLKVSPERLRLGVLKPGAEVSRTITVENVSPAPVSLARFEGQPAEVVRIEGDTGPLAPGETRTLTVRVTPPEGRQRLTASALLHTDHPKTRMIRVLAFGTYEGAPPQYRRSRSGRETPRAAGPKTRRTGRRAEAKR